MKLSRSNIRKLENFLEKTQNHIYPEPPDSGHEEITRRMITYSIRNGYVKPGSRILDVGCGQGVALEIFAKYGFSPIGITLGKEDLKVCRQKGFEVYEMDQSFLDFENDQFDFIWCRHCLEHSIFPYFTLSEFYRVLRPKCHLYIEIPAPDTSCAHQTNQNHYSVLGKKMWLELIRRTGFQLLKVNTIEFETNSGPDTYYALIQQKPPLTEHSSNDRRIPPPSIRERYRLERSKISQIDLARFSKYVANKQHHNYFMDVNFKEHYRLIAYLSTLFNFSTIFDIGTCLGYSALAFSYNLKNSVVSYDIVDLKELNHREELMNIEYRVGDVLQDRRLIGSPLIMLDTNHDGVFEKTFYNFLKENHYRGLLFLDDIHLNQQMKNFWNSIAEPKEDITDLGHWSGSGIVDFSRYNH